MEDMLPCGPYTTHTHTHTHGFPTALKIHARIIVMLAKLLLLVVEQ